jgi:hypothetical protein
MLGVAVLCGAATGRTFALEAENRRVAVLAAAYCGAGAGLMAAPIFTFLLVLTTGLMNPETGGTIAALGEAAEATGPALLWGATGGAGGGLAIGTVIALFKSYAPQ